MANEKSDQLASTWCELPQEIVSNIERRLDSAVDVSQLRSVCKNWHNSREPDNVGILSLFLPRIISNVKLPFVDRQNDPVILIARAVFLVKPLLYSSASRGWLLTVEEMVPGKLRILYPLSTDHVELLPSNFPKYLDLSKFKVKQVAKTYGFKYASDGKDVPGVSKVVICSTKTAMVLYGGGTLIVMRLTSGIWSFVCHSIITSFSDVISYGENYVRAIDYLGNMHTIDHRTTEVIKTISPASAFHKSNRIILLVSYGKSYAVVYTTEERSIKFGVYRLNEMKNKWIDATRKTFCDKVLFVSSDWSFFLYTSHASSTEPQSDEGFLFWDGKGTIRADYVIYSEVSFNLSRGMNATTRVYEGASIDLQISVFFFDSKDFDYWRRADCSRKVTNVLWPPPTWFLPETYLSVREDEDLNIHIHAEASTKATTLVDKSDLKLSFHGIEVQSEHLPVLQDVWKKHGDVLEGSLIRSRDARVMALACLAKMLIVLRDLGKGFDNDQAEYVESILSDLKLMGLKLEWLVPLVEQVLSHQKQLHADLVALEEAKSKVEKTEQSLLAVIAELEQVLCHDT